MLASFEAICVQSDEGVDDLRRAGYRGRLENIPLLPPPVAPPADFPAARGDGVVRLGYLGRLEAQKNLGYLLEVYRELTRAPGAPRYELHLFGEGAQRAGLEARSRELALEGVTFHGAVPRAEINQRIDRCDLFLITSTTEGQCLVALEVLARGRPLVRHAGRLAARGPAPGGDGTPRAARPAGGLRGRGDRPGPRDPRRSADAGARGGRLSGAIRPTRPSCSVIST
ncbi:MAG: glycosyltransferase [Verrucomicrobiota bacterium]